MKHYAFLFVLLIVYSCQPVNDLSRNSLHGKISTLKELDIDYNAVITTNITTTLFNSDGFIQLKVSTSDDLSIQTQYYTHLVDEHMAYSFSLDPIGITNRVTEYKYTKNGMIKQLDFIFPLSKSHDKEIMHYDGNSQLTQRIVWHNDQIILQKDYLYSKKDRIDILTSTIPGLMTVIWRHYYDDKGRLHTIISDNQKVVMLYDANSRLTQEVQLLPNNISLYKKNLFYDKKGNITNIRQYEALSNDWQIRKVQIKEIDYLK